MRFFGTGLLAVSKNDTALTPGAHVREAGDRFFVDTRWAGDGKAPVPSNGCQLTAPAPGDLRHAALFIDLGSTRTLGLVVPNTARNAEWNMMRCRTLDLVDYAAGNDDGPAPFPSQVVLEGRPKDVSEETWPLSEVRTGKAASELYLYGAMAMAEAERRGVQLMASSPKRMIARGDRDRTWRMIGRGDGPPLESYFGPDLEEGGRAEGLVPSRLVGMQVVELLEQAERMLNSQEETHAYRVDEVHVTYPPGWLGPVQEDYKRLMQAEVDRWAKARALAVEVKMGCSEALGALLFHWYNRRLKERRGGGAQSKTGANSEGTGTETLAVVDVGGGTSDLLIERITFSSAQNTFEFIPLRRQSEETAGDELVRRVAVDVVLPVLLNEGYGAIGNRSLLLAYLRDDALGAGKRLWMRKHLLPLALFFTEAADRGELLPKDKPKIRDHLTDIIKTLDEVCQNMRNTPFSAEDLGIKILSKAKEKVPALAEEVFKSLAKSFAEICKRHNCTEVMLSGKAMDFADVKAVFEKAFREEKVVNIVSLAGQEVAKELQDFLGGPTVKDSKYATVWGSICKWWLESYRGHFADEWNIVITEAAGIPNWYLHGAAARLTRADCTKLEPVRSGGAVRLRTLPMALSYVACEEGKEVGADEDGAAPVRMYKLAFRDSDMELAPGSEACVALEFVPGRKPHVKSVGSGRVVRTTRTGVSELQAGDLEVTLALDYAAHAFWLDSGIVELLPESIGLGGARGGRADIPSKAHSSSAVGSCMGASEPSGHQTGVPGKKSPDPDSAQVRAINAGSPVKLGKSKKRGAVFPKREDGGGRDLLSKGYLDEECEP